MKAVVAAFNQEKALVGASSVITNLRMELFEALLTIVYPASYLPIPAHLVRRGARIANLIKYLVDQKYKIMPNLVQLNDSMDRKELAFDF